MIVDLLPRLPTQNLRLVLDGAEPSYMLTVNGREYGTLSNEACLAGIAL